MKKYTQKIIWGLVLFLAFFFIFTSFCFASNINMNHIEDNSVSANNQVVQETANTEETTNTTNTTTNTQTPNTTSQNLPTSTSTTVSNILPESDLGLANILSILLITVGVILILLAIAILIRLK